MNVAGCFIPGIVTSKLSIQRAPDFTLTACTLALPAKCKSRLAILTFVIVAREIRAGTCPSSAAVRAARFGRHAFVITKDIAIGTTAIIIALVPVIQTYGAAIDDRAIDSFVFARLRATGLCVSRIETGKAIFHISAIYGTLDFVKRTLRDKFILGFAMVSIA